MCTEKQKLHNTLLNKLITEYLILLTLLGNDIYELDGKQQIV